MLNYLTRSAIRKAEDKQPGGNLARATYSAYNGGPGNANRWLKQTPDDPDLFIELIDYAETRDYVRSIYEIFNIYRRLYNRSP